MTSAFGQFFKTRRLAIGKTLRQFCAENGFDAANISRIERGLIAPPRMKEKLEHYAAALEIVRGTDAWLEFFDLASVEAGRIPKDILDDAAVVRKLPAFFRTMANKQLTEDKLDQIIELIRRA